MTRFDGSIRTSRGQFRAIQHVARLRFAPRVAWEQRNRSDRDGTPAIRRAGVLVARTQAKVDTTGSSLTQRRHWAHACRDGEVLCGRVELTVRADARLGLAPRERRCIVARFRECLHPALRADLADLVRRRGATARRVAERMAPIELVFVDPDGSLQRLSGWLQPPQQRHGDLRDIEFVVRESVP